MSELCTLDWGTQYDEQIASPRTHANHNIGTAPHDHAQRLV
jgi:D-alanyl-D-alanine dipeptidase